MNHIYLDNNASTHVHAEVMEEMLPLLKDVYGNPSSSHQLGIKSKEVLESARNQVASMLGCNAHNIIFTSGGTESNNLAISGFAQQLSERRHFITSTVEHPSVLRIFRFLESKGHLVTYLPVDNNGLISPHQVEESIIPETTLISLMMANNETGVIFPIREIGEIARRYDILFHCDAVQGVGKIPIDVEDLMVDFLTVSAHKTHGPKGAGVLYIRRINTITPITMGGGQENGKRSGTEALPAIVGMGKACEIALQILKKSTSQISALRDRLEQGILETIAGSSINGSSSPRLCNTANVSFPGTNSTELLAKLSEAGIYASGGSACSSHHNISSYVLMAMGLTESEANSSLRFSLSIENTAEQIEQVIQTIVQLINNVPDNGHTSCTRTACAVSASEEQSGVAYYDILENDLQELQMITSGDPHICIAVLDGSVDLTHPCFSGAQIDNIETLISGVAGVGPASRHGTHVASIIFGQQGGVIHGIAPGCRGLIMPLFSDGPDGTIINCTQLELARAITRAVQEGANIICISGGQLSSDGKSDDYLTRAVRLCAENGVLVVAAAGNDGCQCLHVPAALPSVLAVGAMDSHGLPLDSSNWGEVYQTQGILAPGENIPGAVPGGGVSRKSGTSFATPIIAGIAALLMSLQLKDGENPNPMAVKDALLASALPCVADNELECRRFLAGRINIPGALQMLDERAVKNITLHISNNTNLKTEGRLKNMSYNKADVHMNLMSDLNEQVKPAEVEIISAVKTGAVSPSGCGENPTLVYAIGQLGYDFGTEARRDSFTQLNVKNPNDPSQLLEHLSKHRAHATSVIWTLNHDQTPIYAIQPTGAYAHLIYEELQTFLGYQIAEGAERVSIPGVIAGKVTLINGHTIPVIIPEPRGMFCWSTSALVKAVAGDASQEDKSNFSQKINEITNFLDRIYYEIRNLGVTPQERALNYAATNAYQAEEVIEKALKLDMHLDSISAERSPVCRPNSDCWDIKLTFFNPAKRLDEARIVFRFTVDVSDVVPVSVGDARYWYIY